MTTNILIATITAYCACKTCCGPNAKGITANGNKPKEGITIAASRRIPFSSTVVIETIPGFTKSYIVQDRLAKRYDNRFDVYYKSHSDAKKFGIKHNQTITIITP